MDRLQQDRAADRPQTKRCAHCGEERPLGEFRRRTGRRAGKRSRRGACRECRRRMKAGEAAGTGAGDAAVKPAAGPAAGGADLARKRAPLPAAPDVRPGAPPSGEPAPGTNAVPAQPQPAASGPEQTDAGEDPAPAPARKRKKRRGKRGGRRRNKRRAAADPDTPAERTASEPSRSGRPAEPSRSGQPGAGLPGGPTGAELQSGGPAPAAADEGAKPTKTGRRKRKKATWVLPPLPPPPRPEGPDPSVLSPGKSGVIWMRGHTDKGRRWRQETDLETAVTLVREYAAVVVNRRTIRRLHSNKAFREYILQRDNYTCYFCGKYGDTIDHIVPRAKGGHTTPLNCVTACRECNQNKAALDLEEFVGRRPPRSGDPT